MQITAEQYQIKKKHLQSIVLQIPKQWGSVQNNAADAGINMFAINDFTQLCSTIQHLPTALQHYLKRRWFLWQCSICDEYLFCQNSNVIPNPDAKSKVYDIQFNNDAGLCFDIKGTVIPKQFRTTINQLVAQPQPLINFYYEQQSKEVRYGLQNRLFIIHHSFRKEDRELILRPHFDFKEQAYKAYATALLQAKPMLTYQSVIADAIFIIENEDRSFAYKFL